MYDSFDEDSGTKQGESDQGEAIFTYICLLVIPLLVPGLIVYVVLLAAT